MRFEVRCDDPSSLLNAYAVALHGLRSHGVIRSFNSPVGDIAEWIVSKKLQLTLTPMSNRSHDAIDASGARYQIKARWCPGANRSKQLGAVRDLARRLGHGTLSRYGAMTRSCRSSRAKWRISRLLIRLRERAKRSASMATSSPSLFRYLKQSTIVRATL
jgi:hypothetical protein